MTPKATVVAMIASLLVTDLALAQYLSDRRESTVRPSISTQSEFSVQEMSWGYICYSILTGRTRGCKLLYHTLFDVDETVAAGILSRDCEFLTDGRVKPGTCANAGHEHLGTGGIVTEPKYRINATDQLEFDGTDDDSRRDIVTGDLGTNEWRYITYNTPDNAGSFYFRGELQPPDCFFLPDLCGFTGRGAQANGNYLTDGTVNVRVDGLIQLPDVPSLYTKARNPDLQHRDPAAFAGTPKAVAAVILIANEFKTRTGRLLRPNDMSLPYGGLFDVKGTWDPGTGGHFEHREGLDVDFNRFNTLLNPDGTEAGTSFVECEDDRDFIESVNALLIPAPGQFVDVTSDTGATIRKATAVRCERNPQNPNDPGDPKKDGRYHVDITDFVPDSAP